MHKLTSMIVDYDVVQSSDEDNGVEDTYFPIYEYEWGGTKKRLESKSSVRAGAHLGKTVHILVEPQTENAVCLEDKKQSQFVLLIFGAAGVAALVLVVLVKAGILS